MIHKRLVLVASLLILFIFQPADLRSSISFWEKVSSRTVFAQANSVPTQLYVTMLHLDSLGYPVYENGDVVPCYYGDTSFGCAEPGSPGYLYEYNPVWVDVENDYLLDVLPREMDVVTNNPPTLVALQAQALAARSLADWKFRYVGDGTYMDNSIHYQVFIPYAFEYYTPDDMVRQLTSEAVSSTSGQYLSYGGESIDAEFGSDMYGSSDDEGSKV